MTIHTQHISSHGVMEIIRLIFCQTYFGTTQQINFCDFQAGLALYKSNIYLIKYVST